MAEEKTANPEENKEEQKPAEVSGTSDQGQSQETPQAEGVKKGPVADVPTETPETEPDVPSGRKMALIAIVVMALALGVVIAGIISGRQTRLAKQKERELAVEPTPTPTEKEDMLTASYKEMSETDEIYDIEADLDATSFEEIDAELTDIDKELTAED